MQSWAPSSVLVTGANRGLGLELVHQLARAERPPRYLLAGCRQPESTRAQDLMNLAKSFSNIKVLKLDVDDYGSIQECAAQIEKILGNNGLNLLVNNAGVGPGGALNEVTPESMMNSYRTNVVGPVMVTKVLLPSLQQAAWLNDEFKAAVINMSSILASIELFDNKIGITYAYRASKTALNMVTKCLANELKPHGIICASMHPGWVQTEMGGEKAPLTKEVSVRGTLQVLSTLSAKDSGSFLDWKGQHLPW
ncbi:C-signal-like [Stegostoma tigrinum]|uniref:C-signal-like n=1 Tax=Stegostoma tigrinum TaxID=3053191 RepID=UPI00202AFFD3|nr:C-signal-like [Stegostoma tigrinum]